MPSGCSVANVVVVVVAVRTCDRGPHMKLRVIGLLAVTVNLSPARLGVVLTVIVMVLLIFCTEFSSIILQTSSPVQDPLVGG